MANASAARASRAIGAMIFAVFGAIWLVIWSQRAYGVRPFTLALIAVGAISIFVTGWRLYQQNRTAHAAQADSLEQKKAGRIFNIVNITQWVAILIVGNVLANVGLKDWVLASAMLIIGLHFFPLARAFGNPLLNFTGAAMIVVAIVYPFVAPRGAANPVGCFAAGIILWLSAIVSLTIKPSTEPA